MRKSTTMPLNQPSISWRPVAPTLCLALVLAGGPMHISQVRPGSPGAMANGSWRPR
jgi:hypothetical protein